MSELLNTALSAAVLVAASLLVPLARTWLTSKIGQQKADMLFSFAEAAVGYAEQVAASMPNDAKKSAALTMLKELADSHNVAVTPDAANAAIEAAVHKLKAYKPAATSTTPESGAK